MTHWRTCSEERFFDMLGILPPAVQTGAGFLVGEPSAHRRCRRTGIDDVPTFAAFVQRQRTRGATDYFEAAEPMTVAEFRAATMNLHEIFAGADQ